MVLHTASRQTVPMHQQQHHFACGHISAFQQGTLLTTAVTNPTTIKATLLSRWQWV